MNLAYDIVQCKHGCEAIIDKQINVNKNIDYDEELSFLMIIVLGFFFFFFDYKITANC